MGWQFSLEENDCYGHRSVYFTPEYQSLWAAHDNAKAMVIRARSESGVLDCPILVRQLDEEFCEAYSAYGYGGFLSPEESTALQHLSSEDFVKLISFLKQQKIIDLFIRNMPFENYGALIPEQFLTFNRETLSVDLDDWKADFPVYFNHYQRREVNTARKNGVTAIVKKYEEIHEEDIVDFLEIYNKTMGKNKAKHYYLFPESLIRDHLKLKDRIELIQVYKDARVVGCGFFLVDRKAAHAHLGGNDEEYARFRISDMMIHAAITHYARQGKKYLHIGGGRTTAEDDTLLKFKKRYGKVSHRYYVAKIVTDHEAYGRFRRERNLDGGSLFLIGDALSDIAR